MKAIVTPIATRQPTVTAGESRNPAAARVRWTPPRPLRSPAAPASSTRAGHAPGYAAPSARAASGIPTAGRAPGSALATATGNASGLTPTRPTPADPTPAGPAPATVTRAAVA